MADDRDVNLKEEIKSIFTDYVRISSYTNTAGERLVEPFLTSWFSRQDYFKERPDQWGCHSIENDPLGRHVVWGMVRGNGEDTVVMIHHYDVVEISDFETAKPFALDIGKINTEIRSMLHKFDPESIRDLDSGKWQFGRGGADMKAGGAIQLALLEHYSRRSDLTGNLIVVCVPDEENLSAGMRSAIGLLAGLKRQFSLSYLLMINSEPHQGKDPEAVVLYEGTVGKLLPVVYARGSLAHVGRIYEGLNPLHLMSELVIRTELEMTLSDRIEHEVTPPPSWLYFKDTKTHYDVSIPTSVQAYMSVLTLKTSAGEFLETLRTKAEQAFETVLHRMNRSYGQFLEATGESQKILPWTVNVKTFAEIFREAVDRSGERFTNLYQEKLEQIADAVAQGRQGLPQSSFELIAFCLEYIGDKQPLIVIGLSPPYYPAVSNYRIPHLDQQIRRLLDRIPSFCRQKFDLSCRMTKFFTGISDLSYSYLDDSAGLSRAVAENMPLWGKMYDIPFDHIREIRMPCINIGPWGKDFHKLTERVLIEDVYDRTPRLLRFVIDQLLQASTLKAAFAV